MKNKDITQSTGIVKFKKFSDEENKVWKILCDRQLKNLKGKVSKIWEEGWKILGMNNEKIPDFPELNKKLKKLTDWEIVMTNIEYEDHDSWITSFIEKKFRITDYIRGRKDLDYTPLPDIFHDVFGHVPFLAIPQYVRILEKFGRASLKAKTKEDRSKIQSLAWYGYEFGFIKKKDEIKIFGTGLVSSKGELKNALSDEVPKLPYQADIVANTSISAHEFHEKLFVLEGLDQLEEVVDKWL